MRTFVFFGVRVLSEREWRAHIALDNSERQIKLALEEKLRTLTTAGTDFNATVKEEMAKQRRKNDDIRALVETTLSCNIRLAHRAQQAEHTAALLREQLTKMLRQS